MAQRTVVDVTDEPPARRRDEEPDSPTKSDTQTEPVLLTAPRDGTPEPIIDRAELARAVERFAQGTGPVAVAAERASGYRYTHRAYLVQLRRAGAGTVLLDPLPFGTLPELDEAISPTEWILHAASQDLPCLTELGL